MLALIREISFQYCSFLARVILGAFSLSTLSLAQITTTQSTSTLPSAVNVGAAVTAIGNIDKIELTGSYDSGSGKGLPLSMIVDSSGRLTTTPAVPLPQPFESLAPRICRFVRDAGSSTATHHCQADRPWVLPTLTISSPPDTSSLLITPARLGTDQLISVTFLPSREVVPTSALLAPKAPLKRIVFLAPDTLLPRHMKYVANSESHPSATGMVEIEYSDYRLSSGVQIPFHIVQSLNGTVVLDFSATQALVTLKQKNNHYYLGVINVACALAYNRILGFHYAD